MTSASQIAVEVASDVLPDQESTNFIRASCLEYVYRKTIWFVRRTRTDHRLACKVSWRGYDVRGFECVLLHEKVHFHDDQMWLPTSYEPYMGHQFWVDLSGGPCDQCDSTGISLWGDYQLDTLGGLGFELTDGDDGDFHVNDLALRRCKMADFELMRSNPINGEQPRELVVPDVARPDLPPRRLHVFAGAFHGKTTAMNDKIALDLESNVEVQREFLEELGIEYTDEMHESTLRWEQVQENGDDTNIQGWFQSEGPDVYGDLLRVWINSDVPVTTSHLSQEALDVAVKSGRAIMFVTLSWDEVVKRIDEDDSGYPLIRSAATIGYYMGRAELAPRGPAFPTVAEAVAVWREGLESAESCGLCENCRTEDMNA